MNYQQFVIRLVDALGEVQKDVNLPVIIPNAIDMAEQRIYRDLQLLGTVTRDSTFCVPSSRDLTLPSNNGRFVSVTEVNVISSAGTTSSNGTRNPLTRTSPRLVNFLYPTEASTTGVVPSVFCMNTDQSIIMGPAPGSSFSVEIVGTIRPNPLSSGNSSTYLASYLPDLFFTAAMAGACYSMGDKGAVAYQYWDTAYKNLIITANSEEAKKKYQEYYTPNQLPAPQDNQGTV